MRSSRWIDRVAAALVSIAMSGAVSAVMVLANQGLTRSFPLSWVKGWLLGFLVSFPTAFIVVPLVQRWAAAARMRTNSPDEGKPEKEP
jgi:hypothetical protein